jgi:hypothetical protein
MGAPWMRGGKEVVNSDENEQLAYDTRSLSYDHHLCDLGCMLKIIPDRARS